MDHSKMAVLFLIVYSCCLLATSNGNQRTKSGADLNCDQYANDLAVLTSFPFKMNLDPQKQGPGISTAILDPSGTIVEEIQLRQAGATVPESVFCLKHLEGLDVMNMILTNGVVPDALSNFQNLSSLFFTNVPVSKMTDELATLKHLEMLSMDNCSLTDIPDLSGLPVLYRVFLPNNRLSKLEGLPNVYVLSLYKNIFTEIPVIRGRPARLLYIDMNFNPVKEMSILSSYTNLTEIRLSDTDISVIPPAIGDFKYLFSVDLSNTQITDLPKTILKPPYLKYVVVQNNQFSAATVDIIKKEFSTERPDVTLLI